MVSLHYDLIFQARAKRRLEAIEREMERAATRRLGDSDDDDDGKIKRTKIDREDAVEGEADEDDLDREDFEVNLDYGDDDGEEGGEDRKAKRGGGKRKAGRRRYRRKGEQVCCYIFGQLQTIGHLCNVIYSDYLGEHCLFHTCELS